MAVVPYRFTGSDRSQSQQSFTFRTHNGRIVSASVAQEPVSDARDTNGGAWDSAVVLADWAARQDWPAGSVLADVGAGTGLLSLVLAQLDGVASVVALDMPAALAGLSANVAGSERVAVRALTWGDPLPRQPFACVFLADCVFGDFDLDSLLTTLAACRGARLVFGYKVRRAGREEAFFRRLEAVCGTRRVLHAAGPEFERTHVSIIELRLP